MKSKYFTFLNIIFISSFVFSGFISLLPQTTYAFPEVISPEQLKQKYNAALTTGTKVKVLIIPGHDDDSWGTEFRGVREGDMNAVLAEKMYAQLKKDPRLEVRLSRELIGGYDPVIWDYIDLNRAAIADFIRTHRQAMTTSLESGTTQEVAHVPHNPANPENATRLYGVNKWANDNNIDLVISVHFNDYGGRPWDQVGQYKGLTVYIPEKQYGNARASKEIGSAVYNQLTKFYPKSTYPPEAAGLVEDQSLIALGGSNTLNAASILTEYGYIYEPQFLATHIREKVITDLAYQTAIGVETFFDSQSKYQKKFGTTLLPYTWSFEVKFGAKNSVSILALQAALRKEGMYPATGFTSYDCAMTGNFDTCTKTALQAFQAKYKIPSTGVLGPMTRAKLNSLFSK